MSKISIVINDNEIVSSALFEIKRISGLSMDDISTNILNKTPIYERQLFMNDHIDAAEKLNSIVDVLHKNKIAYSIFELDDEESYNKEKSKNQEISDNIMKNIINSHISEVYRQQNL